ncbi:MAG: histidine phosphatase family protein, partial [Verrucomicrobiae bacterium]|nr:histidine phosphatase family protein [Verrucomicrobiae bacterium]
YLLRHSTAEDLPPPGLAGDRFRRLTPEGREKARRIGRAIQRLSPGIEWVLTSPAPRARETADAVVGTLRPRPPVEELDALWIGGEARAVAARLRRGFGDTSAVLLVGHEPDLGRLASLWLTGGAGLRLVFKKGGLCKLTVTRPAAGKCAVLDWLLAPRQLALIAGAG